MKIEKVTEDKTLKIALEGRLDTLTAPELEKELEASMPDAQALTLDLKNLEYISSAGLRVLLAAHKTMAGKSGMKLTNVNEIVKEVLDITDFSSILTIE